MSVIVDDHSNLVQYNPPSGWTSQGGSIEFLATTTASKVAGSTAIFTFEGTSVSVFGTVGPSGNGSRMGFSIDQSLSSSYTAPVGLHTLVMTLETSSETEIIFFDYLLYNTETTVGKTLFIDDDDIRVQYSSGWKNAKNSMHNFQHGAHSCESSGCWASLTFQGNSISVHSPVVVGLDGEGFNASVVIDGGLAVVITRSNQPAGTTYNNQLFASSGLSVGNHTIVITTLNEHPFYIDYFLVKNDSSSDIASVSATAPSISNSPSASPHPVTKTRPIAAAVGGSVSGVLLLLLLGGFMWRRRVKARGYPSLSPSPPPDLEISQRQNDDRDPPAIHPFVLQPVTVSRSESINGQIESPPPAYTKT
ncbi:hypothetical protein B0H19DRAFT_1170014 [Mycena capillaripes]|nr:hypothetical protein B0H19DRAFT_1170014 [Mycena capillaripes]